MYFKGFQTQGYTVAIKVHPYRKEKTKTEFGSRGLQFLLAILLNYNTAIAQLAGAVEYTDCNSAEG